MHLLAVSKPPDNGQAKRAPAGWAADVIPQMGFGSTALVQSHLLTVSPRSCPEGLSLLCHQLLQPDEHPANYSQVVEKLFQVVPNDVQTDASPGRCRTCSVVGNSGNLKGSQCGPLIDASDFVFRWVKDIILTFASPIFCKYICTRVVKCKTWC